MEALGDLIPKKVDSEILPLLTEFVSVPSCSPLYDPEWETNGMMEKAQQLVIDYLVNLGLAGFSYEVLKEPGRAPLFFGEIAGTSAEKPTILLYGHFDKQPPMEGWKEGTGPYSPVVLDGKLYGRGGTDDGYAIMSSGMIIKTLQELDIPHGRIVLIGENEEESGSASLVYYLEKLRERMGKIDTVICLDSGTIDYEHFTLTSSLRGVMSFKLKVSVVDSGKHSGVAGGIVPSAYRIMNSLIARIEDQRTGEMLVPELFTDIPPEEYASAASLASMIGADFKQAQGVLPGVDCISNDIVQLMINNYWKPCLTVVGFEGLPDLVRSGNVIHPVASAKISIRVPPGVNAKKAVEKVVQIVTENPPYNAKVEVTGAIGEDGWAMKRMNPKLKTVIQDSAKDVLGTDFISSGLGGSIPFLKMLGDMFPQADILATGIVHVESNIHGPNENMHIAFVKKFLTVIAKIIAQY